MSARGEGEAQGRWYEQVHACGGGDEQAWGGTNEHRHVLR